ncbi:MAG: D-alanyl-D-alanine carboxypeptidase/D-alanyl-D-alanine-endopeptidase [Bacteroidota bacterium]|jgi:D-alanyl-D-alanine carboxypeptidase/D-alanyl-D-alanine-endopeptidase (penicillin-binding protein 4)
MSIRNIIALIASFVIITFQSCSIEKQLHQQANQFLLKDSTLSQAHIGIAVQELETKKWLYQFQSDKLFTPASNTKIVSCYTAMKYLPDHLPAALVTDLDTALLITPTGDPTFLHPRFKSQPFFDYLKTSNKSLYLNPSNFSSPKWGHGWSWEDYAEDYMIERNAFPVYGNQVEWFQERSKKENPTSIGDTIDVFMYSSPEINWKVDIGVSGKSFQVERSANENHFTLHEGKEKSASTIVPFITNGLESAVELLRDTLHKNISIAEKEILQSAALKPSTLMTSQPTDSMLKDMMDRSDNFFADMCVEMASQLSMKKMDESAAIASILKNDFSALPQQPKWVDGSGLSRYNLFSPEDMIWILQKMKEDFGWERIRKVMPGAGSSNLKMYPVKNNEYIFAKTGTLNGVVCLSGFYLNKKNKWLTFSVMVNNHHTTSAYVRKKIASFLGTL